MTTPAHHVIVVGAGAAGLMAGRELARRGRRVTILEARRRCGGRIWALPADEFGYRAEGGAEFVHGAARVTVALLHEAGLQLAPRGGGRWRVLGGKPEPAQLLPRHEARLHQLLTDLEQDLPVAEFLERHFGGPEYAELRRQVTRMVEGYDAADPRRASTFAVRDEWLGDGLEQQGRVAGGYGALIDFLDRDCRRLGAEIRFEAAVAAIAESGGGITVRCRDGSTIEGELAIVTVPLPILGALALPPLAAERARAVADFGYGNVVKFLLRFRTRWWTELTGGEFADLGFVLSEARVPTWWTQYPGPHTVLTGWFAGPRAETVAGVAEPALIDMGLAALAEVFGRPADELQRALVAARAINWGADEFARGAYSYATPATAAAQEILRRPAGRVWFCGEALYTGPDRGTVEAALAHGKEVAEAVLAGR